MNDTSFPLPLLSIITVCLNEPGLERTCANIVNQTFQDFEWIVIDGGSDAKTLAIFEKYKWRMHYFASAPDGGIYDAMNKGIERARGEWLNFMNAGDRFYSVNTLAELRETFERRLDIDVLYGEREKTQHGITLVTQTPKTLSLQYFYSYSVMHQASFIQRKCFQKYGPYDTHLRIVADYTYFVHLFRNQAKFMHLDKIIAVYAPGGASFSKACASERAGMVKKMFSPEEIMEFSPTSHVPLARNLSRDLRNHLLSQKKHGAM